MDTVPKESETIAHKRAIRISEKLKEAREAISFKSAGWASGNLEFLSLFLLFIVNFVLIYPIIGEAAVSVNFSGPIVPILAKTISVFGPPFMYSVQLVNVLFFLAFPISFYFFVKYVGGRKFAAFLAALVATLPAYIFAKSRFEYGLLSSDSPYIASLTILPISTIMLLKFLRNGGVKNLVVVCVTNALLALISPFGIFIFTITAIVTTFSEMLLGSGRVKILRFITVCIFSASLVSFWYNPGFFIWMITGPMGEDIRGMMSHIIPISFFVVPILTSLGYLLFDRKPNLQPLFLALFYSLVFLVIVIAGGGFVPGNPGRYIPMLGISLSFLIGIASLMGFENLDLSKLSESTHIKGLKNLFLIFVAFGLITFIIGGRSLILNSYNDVLGAWTDIEKGDVWVARDKFSVTNSLPGYLITIGGVGSLTYLYRKKGNI